MPVDKHVPTLKLVVDNSGGAAPLLGDKGPHLFRRLRPEAPARSDARHKLSVVHRQTPEGRFGHAGVSKEGVDIGKELFFRVHAQDDGGLYPISQRVSSHSRFSAAMGNVPSMRTDLFRARLQERVEEIFGGDMKAASRAAGLGATYVRDLLKRERKTSPNPEIEKLEALARALNCSVAYLIGEADDPNPAVLRTEFTVAARSYLDALSSLDPQHRAVALAVVRALAEAEVIAAAEQVPIEEVVEKLKRSS